MNFDEEGDKPNEDLETPFGIQDKFYREQGRHTRQQGGREQRVHVRSSFSFGTANNLKKELYGNGATATVEAPHLVKLAETARSSAHHGQP